MSTISRETDKMIQRQIDNAKRRGEVELKHLKQLHENMKTELKKTNDAEIAVVKDNNQSLIEAEAGRKERILGEMKNRLESTKKLTEKELKSLRENTAQEKYRLAEKDSMHRERLNAEQELFLEDLNFRFNQSAKKMHQDGNRRVEETQALAKERIQGTEREGQEKLQLQTSKFVNRLKGDELNYRRMKDQQDNQFKTERLSTNMRQKGELNKMTRQHADFVEQQTQSFRKALDKQDRFFEKRFADRIETQNKQVNELEEKNKKIVEDLKTSLTTEITKRAEKQDDSFFQLKTIKPTLKQFDDRVEVSVAIPEYSKADISLSLNNKEAIVSFNRRYSDASRLSDGTINKINRIESYSTRIPTGHILDPKTVKSNYNDGIMTYVIKKV